MKTLTVVGAGMGNIELLTETAKQIITNSLNITAPERFKKSLIQLNENIQYLNLKNTIKYIKNTNEDITIVVSGDVGFFSMSDNLLSMFSNDFEIKFINGLNSMQYFASKLCISYKDWKCLSFHGRNNFSLLGSVSYNEFTFILAGGEFTPEYICSILSDYGMGDISVTVGENLSYDDEKIISSTAYNISKMSFDSLSVLLIHNKNYVNNFIPIKDSDFLRSNVPMTKEAVRWYSVNKLEIQPSDIVFDIGAGTGSVSVEMARKAFDGIVIAFEKDKEAVNLISANMKKLGAYNINIIECKAPDNNCTFVPNKVFIGGTGGNLFIILEWLKQISTNFKIVINCITLETLSDALHYLKELDFSNIDVVCINAARSKKVGSYNIMNAENPVYIISGDYKE